MKNIYHRLTNLTLLAVVFAMAVSVSAQVRPYRVTDNQVQTVIRRIETRTDTFRRQIDRWESRNTSQFRDQLEGYVADFENATDNLRTNFTSRRSSADDVEEVLNRAAVIDSFMRTNRVNYSTQSQWNLIRSDLNILAGYYRVSWNWNRTPTYPNDRNNPVYKVPDYQVQSLLRQAAARHRPGNPNGHARGSVPTASAAPSLATKPPLFPANSSASRALPWRGPNTTGTPRAAGSTIECNPAS